MSKKTERFELRLSLAELQALDKLTKRGGHQHRSQWVAASIRRSAKRQKVWHE